ncbi:MAG TPA: adenosylcobinamide-GDP ribazoletransferase [Candidatus Binataceae bacterium]|nr:adenosylcobinamide-GDP ribazoletransferase [Candidatus Binataceae bacterium]
MERRFTARARRAAARQVHALCLAVSFLTILPVGARRPAPAALVAASFGWFPLVGFAIGAMLAVWAHALARLFPPMLSMIAVLGSATLLTGALHLDALADTADALGAGADRARTLEILRDPRIGVYGTLALIFFLALEWAALIAIGPARCAVALYLAFGLSRWSMVAVAEGMKYLRAQGAGSNLLEENRPQTLYLASALSMLGALATGWQGVAAAAAALIMVSAARGFYRRRMGGVTGDLVGGAGALVELAILLLFAALR